MTDRQTDRQCSIRNTVCANTVCLSVRPGFLSFFLENRNQDFYTPFWFTHQKHIFSRWVSQAPLVFPFSGAWEKNYIRKNKNKTIKKPTHITHLSDI